MIKAFDKLDNSKKIPIVIGVAIVLIVFVTLFYYFKNKNVGYSDLKEDSTKAFVYTINSEKNDTYFMNVPYVNIQGAVAKEVNEDVDSFAAEFSNNEKIMLSYEYDINGRILSLLVKCVDYDINSYARVGEGKLFNSILLGKECPYNENDVKKLLSNNGFDNPINISKSNIPYRFSDDREKCKNIK